MMLADPDNIDSSGQRFLYAQVLGIFHANIVYTGPGMADYNARRVEFMWVRWFEYDNPKPFNWDDLKLDSVHFPPMAMSDAFGFVDPDRVLRSCHIIPAFAEGKARLDGIGLSRCARDADDWTKYYINRSVA